MCARPGVTGWQKTPDHSQAGSVTAYYVVHMGPAVCHALPCALKYNEIPLFHERSRRLGERDGESSKGPLAQGEAAIRLALALLSPQAAPAS